jgi:hypothetical protein
MLGHADGYPPPQDPRCLPRLSRRHPRRTPSEAATMSTGAPGATEIGHVRFGEGRRKGPGQLAPRRRPTPPARRGSASIILPRMIPGEPGDAPPGHLAGEAGHGYWPEPVDEAVKEQQEQHHHPTTAGPGLPTPRRVCLVAAGPGTTGRRAAPAAAGRRRARASAGTGPRTRPPPLPTRHHPTRASPRPCQRLPSTPSSPAVCLAGRSP